ncbi:MAG: endonuclease/exonuclease/phosphatase family protein [Marinilabiliaceae bacterium]|nr:endonuclease/exonuclease/phosphatase family protein [Marinilabiliaceae bacterium]
MKKYLKFLAIFALLLSVLEINGQECAGYWDEWDQVASGEGTPSFFPPGYNPVRFLGDLWDDGHNDPGSPHHPGNQGPTTYSSLDLMTYNLYRNSARYGKHKDVINGSGANIVALQEMLGSNRFNRLKKKTSMNGNFLITDNCANWFFQNYGIALLWKNYHLPDITQRINPNLSPYIIGEFTSFCVVCVHYPLNKNDQTSMSNTILADPVIVACQNAEKPIFIAGDFNRSPWGDNENYPIKAFTDQGYEVLNFLGTYEDPPNSGNYKWDHATKKDGSMIDLILEYSTKSDKSTDWGFSGIPSSFPSSWLGKCDCCEKGWCPCQQHVSDHFPYLVKRRWKAYD